MNIKDLEGCMDSCEVGCILICEHAYHFDADIALITLYAELRRIVRLFRQPWIHRIKKDRSVYELDVNEGGDGVNVSDSEGFFIDESMDRSDIDTPVKTL